MGTCTICQGPGHFVLRMRSDRFGDDREEWGLCVVHLRSLTQWRRDQRDLEDIPSMPAESPHDPERDTYTREVEARLAVCGEVRLALEAQAQEIPPLRAIKDAVKGLLAQEHPGTPEAGHALMVAYLEWARAWGTPEHPPQE